MFVAGVVVGVIGGAVVAHSDHSNYGDYGDYSKYGDAALRNEIQEKEVQIKQYDQMLHQIQNMTTENFETCLREITSEDSDLLPNDIEKKKEYYQNNPVQFQRIVEGNLKEKLQSEIAREQKELKDIDALLKHINHTILTKK